MDVFVMAGEQNFWNLPASPLLGSSILGVFQQPGKMAFFCEAGVLRQHAWNHAADRVRNGRSGDFSASEHKIPQGNFFVDTFVDKPLVHPLIMAADQDKPVPGQQLLGLLLTKRRPLRRH